MNKINAPIVLQTDGELMEIKSQEEKKNGMIQINYEGSTQTALILIRPDHKNYDLFIYDKKGAQLKHSYKTIE